MKAFLAKSSACAAIAVSFANFATAKSNVSFSTCSDFSYWLNKEDTEVLADYFEFVEGYFAGAALETGTEQIASLLKSGNRKHVEAVALACDRFPSDSFGHVVSTVYRAMARSQ